jgi:hypothetical protein
MWPELNARCIGFFSHTADIVPAHAFTDKQGGSAENGHNEKINCPELKKPNFELPTPNGIFPCR